SVVALRVAPVAELIAVAVAPAMEAPEGSLTSPAMLPTGDCASAGPMLIASAAKPILASFMNMLLKLNCHCCIGYTIRMHLLYGYTRALRFGWKRSDAASGSGRPS